jgi:hypothetical protein
VRAGDLAVGSDYPSTSEGNMISRVFRDDGTSSHFEGQVAQQMTEEHLRSLGVIE